MTTSDATVRAALAAIVEAIRSGYGADAQRPQDLPDSGYDPAFVERTAPLLEFLWSRYFRVRLLGIENVPDEGAALLVGNHSGGIPTTARCCCMASAAITPAIATSAR